MKRRGHTPEQVIRKLREAVRLIGEGKTIPEAAKELGISEQTYHRWRNQYGGMKADDAKRLKELERENRQLKAIVADQALENRALKEIAKGTGEPSPPAPGGPPPRSVDTVNSNHVHGTGGGPKGFRRWASTRPVSRPSRQPATGPPGSYPDGTHTRRRQRAYVRSGHPANLLQLPGALCCSA